MASMTIMTTMATTTAAAADDDGNGGDGDDEDHHHHPYPFWLKVQCFKREITCNPVSLSTVTEDLLFLIMKGLKSVVLCIAALFVGAFLQGCGCDKDEAKKCAATFATASITAGGQQAGVCAAANAMGKCIKDASCCDYEENGATMKAAVTAAGAGCTLLGGTATNPC